MGTPLIVTKLAVYIILTFTSVSICQTLDSGSISGQVLVTCMHFDQLIRRSYDPREYGFSDGCLKLVSKYSRTYNSNTTMSTRQVSNNRVWNKLNSLNVLNSLERIHGSDAIRQFLPHTTSLQHTTLRQHTAVRQHTTAYNVTIAYTVNTAYNVI